MPETSNTLINPSEPLPRGCSIVAPVRVGLLSRIYDHFIDPKGEGFNEEQWRQTWQVREENIQNFVNIWVKDATSRQLDKRLEDYGYGFGADRVDPETKLTYRTMLAQGMQDLRNKRLVTVTNNRIGMRSTSKDARLAIGGAFDQVGFDMGRPSTGIRRFRGKFIGIVLNAESEVAEPFKKDEVHWTSAENLFGLFDAIIDARKGYVQNEAEGSLDEFFSQEELDQAIDWVLFKR